MVTFIRSEVDFAAIPEIYPSDENDVFGSDFESTDEDEEAGGDEERDSIAERYIQEEERKIRRVCTTRNHPIVDLTAGTVRKRKQSWSERPLWLINTNELPSTPSYIKLLPHERALPIDASNRWSSSTLKRER